jgi:exodeoxyribonuclease V alpha subunit
MTGLERQRVLFERLDPWVVAGAISQPDLAVAISLAEICGEAGEHEILALAFAIAAPQSGHTAVDLHHIREHALAHAEMRSPNAVDDVTNLPWPADIAGWYDRLGTSQLVTSTQSPLVIDNDLVYVRRFFQHECRVADGLKALAHTRLVRTSSGEVSGVLGLTVGQRRAVEICAATRLGVLAGPPGSGKTRTVAALVADELINGSTGRIALAAPTGKAAARMSESVTESISLLAAADDAIIAATASAIQTLSPSTVHRLLGARAVGGFRYNAQNPLPYDLVIVDEASMLSLPLFDALLDALHPSARLVLVGDAGQLASVDAGSVLGDIAGTQGDVRQCVAELTETHRFAAESVIGRFSTSVLLGDEQAAIAVLDEISIRSVSDETNPNDMVLEIVEQSDNVEGFIREHAMNLVRKARDGDVAAALQHLDEFRVLCAHRRGPFGVDRWNLLSEQLLQREGVGTRGWYFGQPVMVTKNDPTQRLFNGDVGVAVAHRDRLQLAFGLSGPQFVEPRALADHETVHAMTIHKSQGSEFDHVVVVLPPEHSRLATRELLYTAVTRARRRVTLVGSRETVLAALKSSERRVSGLRRRLRSQH